MSPLLSPSVANDTWTLLERYKEFIVNGLDLVSFLLVTPELVKLTLGASSKLLSPLILLVGLLVFAVIGSMIERAFPLISGVPIVGDILRFGLLLIILVGVALLVSAAFDRFARNAFLIGAGTFFLSRLIAFVLAYHQLG